MLPTYCRQLDDEQLERGTQTETRTVTTVTLELAELALIRVVIGGLGPGLAPATTN